MSQPDLTPAARAEQIGRKHIFPLYPGNRCSCGMIGSFVTEGVRTCEQLVKEVVTALRTIEAETWLKAAHLCDASKDRCAQCGELAEHLRRRVTG